MSSRLAMSYQPGMRMPKLTEIGRCRACSTTRQQNRQCQPCALCEPTCGMQLLKSCKGWLPLLVPVAHSAEVLLPPDTCSTHATGCWPTASFSGSPPRRTPRASPLCATKTGHPGFPARPPCPSSCKLLVSSAHVWCVWEDKLDVPQLWRPLSTNRGPSVTGVTQAMQHDHGACRTIQVSLQDVTYA
jgi:hypothetical protein